MFSVISFYINSTVIIECILYDLNLLKCIETGLMAPEYGHFGKCSMKRIYILLLIGEVFHKCQVKLVDSVIQIFYILIYFLFTCSISN